MLRRTAVADLGSNSFRLVVFDSGEGWWKRSDEIYEAVRIGAGVDETGELAEERMERALAVVEVFAHFCTASGIAGDEMVTVATSAIRDAAYGEEFVSRAALPIRVLSREEEARYGYLAAVNSSTLEDGAVLDLGGGSLQLVAVQDCRAVAFESWALGAVRMTERFLADGEPASRKQLKALRAHVAAELERAPWLGAGRHSDRLVAIGGTVRNLAAAANARTGLPSIGVQGFRLEAAALEELVEEFASMPATERGKVLGIKPARGDLILAGAAVVAAVLEAGGFNAMEVTEAGLREGIFFERLLAGDDPPLFADVRRSSVLNLAAQYPVSQEHTAHVAHLALGLFDALAEEGIHSGDPAERELLWAAALLHDIGMSIDYDDHHKHSRYLVLNGGLPGFTPRELMLVAQIVRYHRKGTPAFASGLAPLAAEGDRALLERCSTCLRLAEGLERSRDQLVRDVRVAVADDEHAPVCLALDATGDVSVARWAAQRESELFRRAFGRDLTIA